MSYTDWRAGLWHDLDSVDTEQRSEGSQLWSGGGDVRLTTGRKDYDKALKKQAFMVQNDTALYVNLRNYKHESVEFGKNFTQAYVMADSTIVFAFIGIGDKERTKLQASQFFFGVAGSLVTAKNQRKKTALYTIVDDGRSTGRLSKTDVEELLEPYPDVLREFGAQCTGDDYQAPNAIYYLHRAGIIN